MKYSNLFLTGAKNTGKSTLIQRAVKERGLHPGGFLTLPYEIEGKQRGFYFHSLIALPTVENDVPISVQPDAVSCLPVPETFERLGTACLLGALKAETPLIVMDELGRLERTATEFQRLVMEMFASQKQVLGVLKKEEIPWLQPVYERKDTRILDLDVIDFEKARIFVGKFLDQC